MSKRELFIRYILLFLGVCFVGLGIAVAKHSDLGISPISSVANVLSIQFSSLSVGTWIMVCNGFMIIAQIILLRKGFKPIQLLQIPISLLLGVMTDMSLSVVRHIPTELYIVRLALVLAGLMVLSFGITLMVISDTVMNVGEAMVNVIATLMHKNFGSVKVVFDICCVTLSVILSLMFFNLTVVGVREGTVITACCTGLVVKWMTARLNGPVSKLFIGTKSR